MYKGHYISNITKHILLKFDIYLNKVLLIIQREIESNKKLE